MSSADTLDGKPVPLLRITAWTDTYREGYQARLDGIEASPYRFTDPEQADAADAWLRGWMAAGRRHAAQ